jgi:hypothetical protein
MVPMNLSQLFGLACLSLLVSLPTSAQERLTQETCPHPKGWKPTNGELQRVLSEHRQWVEKQEIMYPPRLVGPSEGRANLCNAGVKLNEAKPHRHLVAPFHGRRTSLMVRTRVFM